MIVFVIIAIWQEYWLQNKVYHPSQRLSGDSLSQVFQQNRSTIKWKKFTKSSTNSTSAIRSETTSKTFFLHDAPHAKLRRKLLPHLFYKGFIAIIALTEEMVSFLHCVSDWQTHWQCSSSTECYKPFLTFTCFTLSRNTELNLCLGCPTTRKLLKPLEFWTSYFLYMLYKSSGTII